MKQKTGSTKENKEVAQKIVDNILVGLPDKDAHDYIDMKLGNAADSAPKKKGEIGFEITAALQEMLDKNVSRQAIIDLVRCVKMDAYYEAIENLDDEYNSENNDRSLFCLDKNGEPKDRIPSSLLSKIYTEELEKSYN